MTSSPSVKRIMQEIREIQKEGGGEVAAEALEDDIFEWYFAIRGPRDSDYEGGVYVGRLTLPPDYPLAPPSFTMLTPSGRFETGVRVCLSISGFHSELWSPSWSIRSALLALAAFMPSPGNGAVGAIDGWPREEVRAAARASREAPPRVSSSSCSSGGGGGGGGGDGASSSASSSSSSASLRRQAVVDRLHARLLAFDDDEEGGKGKEEAAGVPAASGVATATEAGATTTTEAKAAPSAPETSRSGSDDSSHLRQRQQQQEQQQQQQQQQPAGTAAAAAVVAAAPSNTCRRSDVSRNSNPSTTVDLSSSWEDALLTALAGALLVAIAGVAARMFARTL